jgi:hypothetical protein
VDAPGTAAMLSRGTVSTPLDSTIDAATQSQQKMIQGLVAQPGGGAGLGLEQRYLQEAEARRAKGDAERAQFDKDNPLPKAAKLEPWTQKLPEPDPAKSFGSWASVFGVLAGSLSRQPLTAALNASGMAMQAMRANDIKAYEDAKQTWKDNLDITLKNSEQEYKAYEAAFKKRQSNWAEGDADFRTAAAAAHNVAAAQHASEESRWGHVTALGNAIKGLRDSRDAMEARAQLDAVVMERVPAILQAKGIAQGSATPQQVQAAQFQIRQDIKIEEARREAVAKHVAAEKPIAVLVDGKSTYLTPAQITAAVANGNIVAPASSAAKGPRSLTEKQRADYEIQYAETQNSLNEIDDLVARVEKYGTGLLSSAIKPLESAYEAATGGMPERARLEQDLQRLQSSMHTRLKSQFESGAVGLQVGQNTQLTLAALQTLRNKIAAKDASLAESLGISVPLPPTPASLAPPATQSAQSLAPASIGGGATPWSTDPIKGGK